MVNLIDEVCTKRSLLNLTIIILYVYLYSIFEVLYHWIYIYKKMNGFVYKNNVICPVFNGNKYVEI